MAWSSLGIVTPSFDWRFFPVDVIGTVAIRATQSFVPGEVTWYNRLFLGEFYGTPAGEFRFLRRLAISTTPTLFEARVPQALEEAGYTIRALACKHGYNGVQAAANWRLELEEWTGPTTPIVEDGGEY